MIFSQEIDLMVRNGLEFVKETEHNPQSSVINFARWIKQFESNRYILASCSWQQKPFYEFLLQTDHNVLLFNCFDPMFPGDNNTPLAHYIEKINGRPNINVVGNNIDNYLNYWSLNFSETGAFKKYTTDELLNANFSKVFLCYQRSNTGHRKELYTSLLDYKDIGTATYATIVNGKPDTPNDIHTLGSDDIWNSHFLNIVSETQYEWNDPYQIFFSEKTWKPIYGLRPFLHFTNVYANDFLKKQGFELFWEDFGVSYNNKLDWRYQIQQITTAIENIQAEDLNGLYKKLLPKLLHNKNNLDKFIVEQQFKVEYLKEYCFVAQR